MGVSWGYHGAERLSAHGIWVCAVPLTQQRLFVICSHARKRKLIGIHMTSKIIQ